jgi:hypothetical protein
MRAAHRYVSFYGHADHQVDAGTQGDPEHQMGDTNLSKLIYNLTCRKDNEYRGIFAVDELGRDHQNYCGQHPLWQTTDEN